ncbi:MAG: hypothetical protein WBA74_00165, partial [Cyclobacteriaceae bacterium]
MNQSYGQNDYVKYDFSIWFSRNGTVELTNVKVVIDGVYTINLPNGNNSNNTMWYNNISRGKPTSIRVHGRVKSVSANRSRTFDRNIDYTFSTANGQLTDRCGGSRNIAGGSNADYPDGPGLGLSVSVRPTLLATPTRTNGFPAGNRCVRNEVSFNYNNLGVGDTYRIRIGELISGNFVDRTVNEQSVRRFSGVSANGTIKFKLEDILGSSYKSYINKNLYFKAFSTSDNICGSGFNSSTGVESKTTSFYKFYPDPPSIQSVTPTAPTCPGGEGSIRIV